MNREEFLARWEADPFLKRAELIEGVVYLPSPASVPHGAYDSPLHLWLGLYRIRTPGCQILANVTWMLLDSSPQPDIAMRRLPEAGGLSTTTAKGDYPVGPAELVVEVCRSSRSYDLGPKLALYLGRSSRVFGGTGRGTAGRMANSRGRSLCIACPGHRRPAEVQSLPRPMAGPKSPAGGRSRRPRRRSRTRLT